MLAACSARAHGGRYSRAFEILRCAGLNVVGQMMVGLPWLDAEDEINTARSICDLGACAARIYPLVVLCNTELEKNVGTRRFYAPAAVRGGFPRGGCT